MFEMNDKAIETIVSMIDTNPAAASELVKGIVEKYKPAVYGVLGALLEVYKDYANNTELAETKAKVYKNMYDAYVGVGFTSDQAIAFMINDNLQLMDAIKNVKVSTVKSENV